MYLKHGKAGDLDGVGCQVVRSGGEAAAERFWKADV